KSYFLISATFDLSKRIEKYSSSVDNIYFREHQQPKGNSCGSFFKNPVIDREFFLKQFPQLIDSCPKKISAGYLLEQSGLKGFSYGGAYFSEKHTNFLMHNGQGKWTDMIYLIQYAQEKVYEKFGVNLENEVQIITP
ncbi:hypothetical protein LAT59_02520, partial [Candidatus Gracilibacteria bacterium]|nr:hypothetical protein [Candidatus Gracilibacteria bacterium]